MTTTIQNNTSISTTRKVFKQYFHEITGRLHQIEDVKTFESGFRVREFVIMSEGYNPEPIVFKLVGDFVDTIEGKTEGSLVKVVFSVKGREWEGRFFNNLEVRSIEVLEEEKTNSPGNDPSVNFVPSSIEEKVPF